MIHETTELSETVYILLKLSAFTFWRNVPIFGIPWFTFDVTENEVFYLMLNYQQQRFLMTLKICINILSFH